MSLNDIVSVTIQAGTANPSRRGFGIPLIVAYHDKWDGDEVRTYTSQSGVIADFPEPRHPVRLAAQALFSQRPRPERIKVGRLPQPSTGQKTVIDLDLVTGDVKGAVTHQGGASTEIDVAFDTDAATTATALAAELNAIAGLTATAAGSVVTCIADVPGESFYFDFSETQKIGLRDTSEAWGYTTALDEIARRDGDFYAVIGENCSAKNMDERARWALANERIALFAPQVTRPEQFTSADFTNASDLNALQTNDAAIGLFTTAPRSAFPEAAWAGSLLPLDPGSATWAFKSLAGVGADPWTDSQIATIETAGGNHYTSVRGLDITQPGKTFGGEWIDAVIGLAWVQARIQERILAVKANNPKVPYTDPGLALLAAEVSGVLETAEARGIFDAGWTVTALPVAEQTPADRADRIARGIEFDARLAGAVHKTRVVGTVSV